jgi:hypothetical protein
MFTIALGIVLAAVILAALPYLILAVFDWRWWRCWALGHRWIPSSERYSSGMLTWTARARCTRCQKLSPFPPENL